MQQVVDGPKALGGKHLGQPRADAFHILHCDELPVIAVIATQAEGTTEIRDAAELRIKELQIGSPIWSPACA